MPIPPTEENLLEDVRKFVSEPAKWAREQGALVAIPTYMLVIHTLDQRN